MSIAHPQGRPGDNPSVTPAPLPFFVYGTLRPGETNHALFLSGRTLTEEPARLTGAVLYDGPGYPYAVEAPGGHIDGDLVTVVPEYYPATLGELDALEEYRANDPDSPYLRVTREVVRGRSSEVVRAWVYLAGPRISTRLRDTGTLIENGDWLARHRPDGVSVTRSPLPGKVFPGLSSHPH
ncbi:gamma-glutamylcyclotransferase family protein [Streptomyces acidiscabies]|uniref:gamma-glutamylcyclotransferase family protein n=1 Tax=Streptomyces acidiscabies TaxID=42234 RepID=UPI0009659E47|nr:gamma-glutamylcyclotransferase family protein [Streptomyces acidiscabies]GAV40573.1 gamma-L-glutamyl-butirosin B gamma-glutamyl cyclotransferase [Streptomyces acidiscabies]